MKIGIHATLIGTEAGGPERYVVGLIKGLASIDRDNQYVIYLTDREAFNGFCVAQQNFTPRLLKPSSRWIEIPIALPVELLRHPVDLVHAPIIAPPMCPCRFVLTVYDLSYTLHPEFYPKSVRLRLSALIGLGIKKAHIIIAISETTKNDIVEVYGLPPERIVVTHLGIDSCYQPMNKEESRKLVSEKYCVSRGFILYVGKVQSRKNISRLIRAYSLLKQWKNIEHKLVLVGRKTWLSTEALKTISSLGLEEEVIQTGHVPDDDLPSFYNAADLFVYPSLFEGFGIPTLEAMACGTPVVASRASSLPEVVGDAAVLVDPYDEEAMAVAMNEVLTDQGLRSRLIEKGFAQSKKYSWGETAKKTLAVYDAVYSGATRSP